VRVVEFERAGAFGEVPDPYSEFAFGGFVGTAPVGLEIAVVRICAAGLVFWVVNQVAVGDVLVVCVGHDTGR
jgi:hypothetical protein